MDQYYKTDDAYIKKLLEIKANEKEINISLDKSENFGGLTPEEVASILTSDSEQVWERVFKISKKIKEHIYGDRIVMFAPLYVSDYCINNCTYCGFNRTNKYERKRLTMEEIKAEVEILEKMGHKRLALEAGEDPINCDIDYILECIKTIYSIKTINGEIRRVNINIASTTVENYKKLKDANIGTYILFQETYNKEAYEKVHLGGPKKDYYYHLSAFDRAMEAGIGDVGAGVLFGFADYKYEVLGLMLHDQHLEKTYGQGFHTVSTPRICDTVGMDKNSYTNAIDDDTFKKIVAVLRLALPYTGIIISTRESEAMRSELIELGISQMSAGSSVEVLGYSKREDKKAQFSVSDERKAIEIIEWLMDKELVPSFCTACYRQGRTGDRFMQLAKTGNIKNVCLPNALITLKEYSLDYGDDNFRKKANLLIDKKIDQIPNSKVKEKVESYLVQLEEGTRDLFL